jgi:hypothetical protein
MLTTHAMDEAQRRYQSCKNGKWARPPHGEK